MNQKNTMQFRNAVLVCVFGVVTLGLDAALLRSRRIVGTEQFQVPLGANTSEHPISAEETISGSRNLMQGVTQGRHPHKSVGQTRGVVMQRPNYSVPACVLARNKGPWRLDSMDVDSRQRPRRILVIGMQSSGASTVLFLLAQIPNSVAVVDLWVGRPAPSPEELGLTEFVSCILLKATVNTLLDAQGYIEQFQPDFSILLLRHPAHNLKSLASKSYRDTAGTPGEKLVELERTFNRRKSMFDLTLAYEDVFKHQEKVVRMLQAKLGLTRAASDCLFDFKRHAHHIHSFTNHHCSWCALSFTTLWGLGNLRLDPAAASQASSILDWRFVDKHPLDSDFEFAQRLAPATSGWYTAKFPELSALKPH